MSERDRLGRRRSPATRSEFHLGRPAPNKGKRYPRTSPTAAELHALVRATSDDVEGARTRALLALLWRAQLKVGEAVGLDVPDVDLVDGEVYVASRGVPSGLPPVANLDAWGLGCLRDWSDYRDELPGEALLCTVRGPGKGDRWTAYGVRAVLAAAARRAGLTARITPELIRWAPVQDAP